MRPKTSLIWKMPREEFLELVGSAKEGVKGILFAFSLTNKGGNHKTLKNRIKQEGLDWDILSKTWRKQSLSRVQSNNKKHITQLLVENSVYGGNKLKHRLINEGLLENKCSKCGQLPEWFSESLVLVIDHINGINNDHRIENLRLLCPNCHSQTSTYAGRNNRGKTFQKEQKSCVDCGKTIASYSIRCVKCAHKTQRKAHRPSTDVLSKEVKELGFEATGRKYGVSGNAVKKWFYYYDGQ